jgi:hypothetical protein
MTKNETREMCLNCYLSVYFLPFTISSQFHSFTRFSSSYSFFTTPQNKKFKYDSFPSFSFSFSYTFFYNNIRREKYCFVIIKADTLILMNYYCNVFATQGE